MLSTIQWFHAKNNKKIIQKKNAFEQTKKKPALKFNPRTLE